MADETVTPYAAKQVKDRPGDLGFAGRAFQCSSAGRMSFLHQFGTRQINIITT